MKEEYMRKFLQGQRELNRKATASMAAMAQANIDMILTAALNNLPANRVDSDVEDKPKDPQAEAGSSGS